MKSNKKIIEVIDKGDPLLIFAEDNTLVETFNDLLKFRLIDIIDERLVLTPKGEEAKAQGFGKTLEDLKKSQR